MDIKNHKFRWVILPPLILYFFSMVVCPFFAGNMDIQYLLEVWHTWQSFNAGMLLFISSWILYESTRYHDEKQKDRNFIAARAFLPEVLSELTKYFNKSATLLSEAYEKSSKPFISRQIPLEAEVPDLPQRYKEIFAKCIRTAEPEIGNYLVSILGKLQIQNSRITDLKKYVAEDTDEVLMREIILEYICDLVELQVLVSQIFTYARGEEKFSVKELNMDSYLNAYRILNLHSELNLDHKSDAMLRTKFTERTDLKNKILRIGFV